MSHTSNGRLGAALAPLSDGGVLSQILRYNDNPITFRTIGGALMVNATQMAKPFARRPSDWLRLPTTRKFISIIQREKNALLYLRVLAVGMAGERISTKI